MAARQSPTGHFHPIEAKELVQMVADDAYGFLTYLRTLEVERQRLTEATDILTTRNLELKDIIDRAHERIVPGSIQQRKINQLADERLAKRVTELEDENQTLRNHREIHALIKTENRLLLADRQYHREILRTQGSIMEEHSLDASYQLYGLGSHIVRLRNERDLLERNLYVTRRVSDIQNEVIKKEYEAQLMGLQASYEALREEVTTRFPEAQLFRRMQNESRKITRDIESRVTGSRFDTVADYMLFEQLADQFDAHLFQFQLRILSLQDENRNLKDELKVTQHALSDLAVVRARNCHLTSETSHLALSFRQMLAETLGTFHGLFDKATDVARRNFEKLQITLEEQARETEDDNVLDRMTAFSKRVRQFGEVPLSKMISEIDALVSETRKQFIAMQDKLEALAAEDYQVPTSTGEFDDDHSKKHWLELLSDGSYHSPASFESVVQSDQETLVDLDTSDSDSSDISPLLSSTILFNSECTSSYSGRDDGTIGNEGALVDMIVAPEQVHLEAAEAEMSWQEQVFPLPSRNTVSSTAASGPRVVGRVEVLEDEIFEAVGRVAGMGLDREPGKCLKMCLKFDKNAVC